MKHLLAIILAFMLAMPVSAQGTCNAEEAVEKQLREKYGEQVVRRGYQNSTQIYEWWESEDGETWTILRRTATGQLCVMASGKYAFDPTPPAEPEGDPT